MSASSVPSAIPTANAAIVYVTVLRNALGSCGRTARAASGLKMLVPTLSQSIARAAAPRTMTSTAYWTTREISARRRGLSRARAVAVRAAAGAGDVSGYEWARRRLLDAPPGPGVAESWVDLALAAARLKRTEEVEEAARLAESIARARKEGQMRLMAESILAGKTERGQTILIDEKDII